MDTFLCPFYSLCRRITDVKGLYIYMCVCLYVDFVSILVTSDLLDLKLSTLSTLSISQYYPISIIATIVIYLFL